MGTVHESSTDNDNFHDSGNTGHGDKSQRKGSGVLLAARCQVKIRFQQTKQNKRVEGGGVGAGIRTEKRTKAIAATQG